MKSTQKCYFSNYFMTVKSVTYMEAKKNRLLGGAAGVKKPSGEGFAYLVNQINGFCTGGEITSRTSMIDSFLSSSVPVLS